MTGMFRKIDGGGKVERGTPADKTLDSDRNEVRYANEVNSHIFLLSSLSSYLVIQRLTSISAQYIPGELPIPLYHTPFSNMPILSYPLHSPGILLALTPASPSK